MTIGFVLDVTAMFLALSVVAILAKMYESEPSERGMVAFAAVVVMFSAVVTWLVAFFHFLATVEALWGNG